MLATKLYIPPPRPNAIARARLLEQLNDGLHRKLSFISAPAGFGKTTLVSNWVANCEQGVAWLSLDAEDNDPTRFLTYFVAALQTIVPTLGEEMLKMLKASQSEPTTATLTPLINDIATLSENVMLVLDDYHAVDSKTVDDVLSFLLEHLPPQMHLVITTREDPQLPLSRLRVRDQLTELRAGDLRFTPEEAAEFLKEVMGLTLSPENITTLETRTEGWIAGLQMAALSMQKQADNATFIQSFSGSHQFVMDYLLEEVLHQQPQSVQTFLLETSILERFCAPLCDAVLQNPSISGQETLTYLGRANMFLIPLDSERTWYRYHHLFADLLRQRLQQRTASSTKKTRSANELHRLASQWYEEHDLEVEAFHHATGAHDIERAVRLIEGKGMPLHFRGAAIPIRNWLASLPSTVLDAWPVLWTTYASVTLGKGQTATANEKLSAAEAALQDHGIDETTRDLKGRIAAIRATLAAAHRQVDAVISQSQRALTYLHPENLAFRTSTTWKLGFAYQLQGNRAAARQAYSDVIATGGVSKNVVFTALAKVGMGSLQAEDTQLYVAAETYESVLDLVKDLPLAASYQARLSLAGIYYEWNDLNAAEQQVQTVIKQAPADTVVDAKVLLARLKCAQGDWAGAVTLLAEAEQFVYKHKDEHDRLKLAATKVHILIHQGDLDSAERLTQQHDLPFSQTRVYLAKGETSAALAGLESLYEQVAAQGRADKQLTVRVLQAVALYRHGEKSGALHVLEEALALAQPGGFIRTFVDEGLPMAQLLSKATVSGMNLDYVTKLLAAFEAEGQTRKRGASQLATLPEDSLLEPLSERELEILKLIAQGLSNREISKRLYRALNTIKGHNRNIFGKLQVRNRTEAVTKARELGLL